MKYFRVNVTKIVMEHKSCTYIHSVYIKSQIYEILEVDVIKRRMHVPATVHTGLTSIRILS